MLDYFESDYIDSKHSFIAASDEVGRGPLAGPVVATTVMVHKLSDLPKITELLQQYGVTDSKKITAKRRAKILIDLGVSVELLCCDKIFSLRLGNKFNIQFSLHQISAASIDQINILSASLLAMSSSFSLLMSELVNNDQGVLLVDGNRLPKNLPDRVSCFAIVKGDAKSSLIGLASILAKEYRDQLMNQMNDLYPGYGFERHAGYGTAEHLLAIKRLGPTDIHRKTFKGVREFVQE